VPERAGLKNQCGITSEGGSIMDFASFFELLMIFCFGLSWPISIRKSFTARTAKGKSLFFEVFIWIGYVAGIIAKFINRSNMLAKGESPSMLFYIAWIFYFINIIEVSIDILLYFRNTRLDLAAER
jgi:hypothetical protein